MMLLPCMCSSTLYHSFIIFLCRRVLVFSVITMFAVCTMHMYSFRTSLPNPWCKISGLPSDIKTEFHNPKKFKVILQKFLWENIFIPWTNILTFRNVKFAFGYTSTNLYSNLFLYYLKKGFNYNLQCTEPLFSSYFKICLNVYH